jgi:hypothetical protein
MVTPQKSADPPVHSLGRKKLSRSCPQRRLPYAHPGWSWGCGFVVNRSPQTVDNSGVHKGGSALSTDNPQVGPGYEQLLHTPVHCSATKRAGSLDGVKRITLRARIGLGRTWVFLGTRLGRTTGYLCMGCAQLSVVHRRAGLSTGSTHRGSGQKTGPDLRGNRLSTVSTPPITTTTHRTRGIRLEAGPVHNSARRTGRPRHPA